MTEVITLNDRNQPMWNYLLKTFVNVCGKCGKKQMNIIYSPTDGKQTDGNGKATNGDVFEL